MSKYKTLKLNEILIEDRLREIDEDFAAAVASSIEVNGQQQPVVVRPTSAGKRPYTLVDGGHRIRALELLGRDKVEDKIDTLDKDKARMVEIDNNLFRADLTALDRAVFLNERKELHERLYPETKHGGDRKSDQVAESRHLKFTEDVAEKMGMSERSIRDAVMIAKKLTPATIKAVRGTPEANNASRLLKLARMEPKAQKVAINLFKETGKLADAIVQAEGGKQVKKKPDAELKYEALISAWKHAPKLAQENFLKLLSDEIVPMLEGLK